MEPIPLLPEPQPCAVCRLPTITRKIGKRMRQPMHVTCDRRPAPDLSPEDLVDVITAVANALGPIHLDPTAPAVSPEEVGPCVRCRRPTRRYGDHGRPFCHRCDEGTLPMFDNVPLFPLGACACGHVLPVAENGEPCPDCLVERERRHDCPVQIDPTLEFNRRRPR